MPNSERIGPKFWVDNISVADNYLQMLNDLLIRRRKLNYDFPDELEYIIDHAIVAIAQECFDENVGIKAKSLIDSKAPELLQSTLSNVHSHND